MKENGGPAFPVKEYVDAKPGEVTWGMQHGMTLRDYFAAASLTALSGKLFAIEEYAAFAYRVADAMIAERQKE